MVWSLEHFSTSCFRGHNCGVSGVRLFFATAKNQRRRTTAWPLPRLHWSTTRVPLGNHLAITWWSPLVLLDCSKLETDQWLLAKRRQCHRPTICFLISDLTNMWLQFWDKQACLAERTSALWATYFEQCVMKMKPTDKREMVKLHSYLSENPFEGHARDFELPFS